jgi:signal transduction histidine kinase
VVGGALDTVAPAAAARDLDVQSRIADGLTSIAADPERLQQILRNLLSNAIKFTDPGGRILVNVEAAHGAIEFRVSDTGQGIDAAFLPHVFERFRQEDPTSTRRHGGLGLGLAIVQDLTRLHGGRVVVMSPGKGQGTTITVTIPQQS